MLWSRVTRVRQPGLRACSQRGAAAVEFALVLPILILILFGIINFGIVLAQKASLANAVRIGARYGSVNAYATTHSCQSVVDKVRASAGTIGIGATNNTQIGVTVSVLKPDGTTWPSLGCSAAVGVEAPTAATAAPCTNLNASKTAPDSLLVETTFDSKLSIFTPGLGSSFNLTNASTFQCEYN
jgi:Flp pilus assembly protein TadG